mmetsp:Transcript_20010/g.29024  ORF Transcript_20010/g.29024 Transcript_20010/m.29024 type:complete len:901 (+) Transcript_20010:308-3010(+)
MSNSPNDPQAGQGRPLPKKEADLFKSVVKHYECKQYKKVIKSADTILKRFPNHGETLCMKGLTLNSMSKREEAHALVKQGLMKDMRSHVCWHVFGLLHRSDRNYNEAIKAYKQALRIDPENLQILRDLSLLQIQMRDIKGFVVTRNTILTLKPNQKINWLAFALAKHLNGDLRGAVSVIDIYLGTLNEGSLELEKGFESSELAMYRNKILAEIPDNLDEALNHLDACKNVIVDMGAWLMSKATFQLKLGKYEEALETFVAMFQRGLTEDYRVHTGYMCALLKLNADDCADALKLRGTNTVATLRPLTDDERKTLIDAYTGDLLESHPRSRAVRRIPLSILVGDKLQDAVASYCRKGLTKGVPSLGSDLSAMFLVEKDGRYVLADDPADIRAHSNFSMLVGLVDGYISSLLSHSKFSDADGEEEESPSTVLWAWYLRAFLHELAGEYMDGIALADKCIEHTPTAVDVYELKARLLQAAGDKGAAADCLDKGRELDKQDRYINNQTTKYMLQADRDSVARERIALFTRHEGNPEQNLYDMQCTWYELELAACMARKGQWGRSLKKYMAIDKHFEDFHEDQFDFHSYCIRKVTLRAYSDVLRFEDNLWGQQYYCQAAEGIIRNYVFLYDNPSAVGVEEEPDYSEMTAAQRKKAKAIARKKKKSAEKKAAEAAEKRKVEEEKMNDQNGSKKKKAGGSSPSVVDEDPDGEELLKRDPLEEAKKYSATLSKHAPNRISTWMGQYDVAIRRKKVLMALQALFKAKAIDKESNELFTRIVDFVQKVESEKEANPIIKEVLASETTTLLEGKSLSDFVSEAASRAKSDALTDLPKRIAVAKGLIATNVGTVKEASSLIIDGGLEGRKVSVDTCRDALRCLTFLGSDAEDAKTEWVAKVKEKFPLMTNFS